MKRRATKEKGRNRLESSIPGKTTKTGQRNSLTAARARDASDVDLKKKVELLARERDEALEQQQATAEVLRMISRSPGELEPVFSAMLENATRICEAKFGNMYLCEGDALRTVALYGASPAWTEERERQPLFRPTPGAPLSLSRVWHKAGGASCRCQD